MRARRVATVVASIVLAAGLQAGVAGADSGSGNGSGGGGAGGSAGGGGSDCAAPGMTEVPLLGSAVTLGLPFDADPSTGRLTLHDGAVCIATSVGTHKIAEALAVPVPALPDLQGAALAAGTACPAAPAGAPASLDCAATVEPVIAYSDPREGANQLGLEVSLPLRLCLGGGCQQLASPEVATAVVIGMLQCSPQAPNPGMATAGGHVICTWRGAESVVDGVPQPAPEEAGADTGTAVAGAWDSSTVSADVVEVNDNCAAQTGDLSSCTVTVVNPYVVAREGGGDLLYADVDRTSTLVAVPRSLGACVQPHGTNHC